MKAINLLPKEHIRSKQMKKVFICIVAAAAIECITAVALGVTPIIKTRMELARKTQLEQEIASEKYDEVRAVREALAKGAQEQILLTDTLKQLEGTSLASSLNLENITSNVPYGVSLNEVELADKDGVITITGSIQNSHLLLDYASNLERKFPKGNLTIETKEANKDTGLAEFELTLDLSASLAPSPEPTSATEAMQENANEVNQAAAGGEN